MGLDAPCKFGAPCNRSGPTDVVSMHARHSIQSIDKWCHDNRHSSLTEETHELNQKLRGHDAYCGVTGKSESMNRFRSDNRHRSP